MMRPPFNPMGGMMQHGQRSAQGGRQPQPAQSNIGQAFGNFMNQMQGKDPNQVLDELVQSGQISQKQLDQAQGMAKRIGGMLDGMRGMFGF